MRPSKFFSDIRSKFLNATHLSFDVQAEYQRAIDNNLKPFNVLRNAIRQHVIMCLENSYTVAEVIELINELKPEIEWRINNMANVLAKSPGIISSG